jgi:hypothetical protein
MSKCYTVIKAISILLALWSHDNTVCYTGHYSRHRTERHVCSRTVADGKILNVSYVTKNAVLMLKIITIQNSVRLTDLVLGIYGPLPILFNPLLSELNAQCDCKKCQHLNGHPLTSMLLAMPWHSFGNSSCTVCSKGFSNFAFWRNYLSRDSIYTSVKTISLKQIQLKSFNMTSLKMLAYIRHWNNFMPVFSHMITIYYATWINFPCIRISSQKTKKKFQYISNTGPVKLCSQFLKANIQGHFQTCILQDVTYMSYW